MSNSNNSSSNKKRNNKRIPPEVAAQYFSHLSNAAAKVDRDPPCSPEEVKALMGMFAEIMGMAEKKSSVSVMFGSKDREWPPSALAAAAKAANMYLPSEDFMDYDDDDEDDDDDDDDDDHDDDDEDDDDYDEDMKRPAIDPSEWQDLEQVARDEKQEEEEKELKAAKKREKKQRKKERLRREASEKAAEAALKKQEKLATSWKSRVVAACQSDDSIKLQGLLGESPFKKEVESKEYVEFLLPHCVAKGNEVVETGADCRMKLADFIFSNSSTALFAISAKTGRSAFHTASFVGDYYFIEFLLERNDNSDDDDDADTAYLNLTCEESGFAPIHYAVLSGSKKVMDALLGYGCKVDTIACADLTSYDGNGITAVELAQCLLESKGNGIRTVGSVLLDTMTYVLSNKDRERQYQAFLRWVIHRLNDVIENGCVSSSRRKKEENSRECQDAQKTQSKSKKKKKKKKQQPPIDQNLATAPVPTPSFQQEDPMIEALLGMGFSHQQIEDAARACGGIDRATADDLVMWIFAKEAGEDPPERPITDTIQTETNASVDASTPDRAETTDNKQLDAAEKAEEARLAQQRLAQKREEQRRRNREWNNREQMRQAQERKIAVENTPITVPQVVAPDLALETDGTSLSRFAIHRALPRGDTYPHDQQNEFLSGGANSSLRHPAGVKILARPKAATDGVDEVNLAGIKKHPPGMETIGADFSRVGSSGIAEDATVSSLGSGIVGPNDWMHENDSFDPPVLTGIQGSSFAGPTPLGFQFGGSNPQSPENGLTDKDPIAFPNDPNPLGQIRATARVFVPTSFKPPPGLSNKNTNGVLPISHAGYVIPEMSSIGGLDHPASMNIASSLLPEGLTHRVGPQMHEPPGLNRFDHLLMAGPTTASLYSNAPSATSSVTGILTTDDMLMPSSVGVPSSVGLGAWDNRSAPLGSTSDPLSLGFTQTEPSFLWGSAAPTQHVTGAPIGGFSSIGEPLPSLSVFGGAFGPASTDQDDRNNAGVANGGGWGATASSSIW